MMISTLSQWPIAALQQWMINFCIFTYNNFVIILNGMIIIIYRLGYKDNIKGKNGVFVGFYDWVKIGTIFILKTKFLWRRLGNFIRSYQENGWQKSQGLLLIIEGPSFD